MAFLDLMLVLSVGFGLYGINVIHSSAKDISSNSLLGLNALSLSDLNLARARLALDRYALDPTDRDAGTCVRAPTVFCVRRATFNSKYEAIPRGADETALSKEVVDARAEMRKTIQSFGAVQPFA